MAMIHFWALFGELVRTSATMEANREVASPGRREVAGGGGKKTPSLKGTKGYSHAREGMPAMAHIFPRRSHDNVHPYMLKWRHNKIIRAALQGCDVKLDVLDG